MNQSEINKDAWNHRAYEYWNMRNDSPKAYADKLRKDTDQNLRQKYRKYFQNITGKKILNPLGSNGRQAARLALLGAELTIIDISEDNSKWAKDLFRELDIHLEYHVNDFSSFENPDYNSNFDITFCEGGILHYFSDLDRFFQKINSYLKLGGELILNDFHPYRKIHNPDYGTKGDYFFDELITAPLAYEYAFEESDQKDFPKCLLRLFTISEIITAIAKNNFQILEMQELPLNKENKIPGEFIIRARKV